MTLRSPGGSAYGRTADDAAPVPGWVPEAAAGRVEKQYVAHFESAGLPCAVLAERRPLFARYPGKRLPIRDRQKKVSRHRREFSTGPTSAKQGRSIVGSREPGRCSGSCRRTRRDRRLVWLTDATCSDQTRARCGRSRDRRKRRSRRAPRRSATTLARPTHPTNGHKPERFSRKRISASATASRAWSSNAPRTQRSRDPAPNRPPLRAQGACKNSYRQRHVRPAALWSRGGKDPGDGCIRFVRSAVPLGGLRHRAGQQSKPQPCHEAPSSKTSAPTTSSASSDCARLCLS